MSEPSASLFWSGNERTQQGEQHYTAKAFTIYHCAKCGVNLNTADSTVGTTFVRCSHCGALNDVVPVGTHLR